MHPSYQIRSLNPFFASLNMILNLLIFYTILNNFLTLETNQSFLNFISKSQCNFFYFIQKTSDEQKSVLFV
jgi:hypothetical protein